MHHFRSCCTASVPAAPVLFLLHRCRSVVLLLLLLLLLHHYRSVVQTACLVPSCTLRTSLGDGSQQRLPFKNPSGYSHDKRSGSLKTDKNIRMCPRSVSREIDTAKKYKDFVGHKGKRSFRELFDKSDEKSDKPSSTKLGKSVLNMVIDKAPTPDTDTKTPTPDTNHKAPTPVSPGKQFMNWLKSGTSGKLWLDGVEKFEEQYGSIPLNKGEGL